jgi:hypothetical protein
MRLSVCLLAVSLLGVVAGAFLIGRWAVGCAVIFDSLCAGWWALGRDDGQPPQAHDVGDGAAADARAFRDRVRRVS